jgi:phosphate transport system substrate-binding protein
MRDFLKSLSFSLFLLANQAVQADRLVLHGSNTIGERLAPNLVEAWLKSRGCDAPKRSSPKLDHLVIESSCGERRLHVEIHAYGTGTGFAELLAGRADLWMASRPVNLDELAQVDWPLDTAPLENVIALDGLSVIVHPSQPVRSLSLAELKKIFSGEIRSWKQLGSVDSPIQLYARDERSGTFDSFKSMVLSGAPLSASARRFESSDQLSARVQSDPLAIGFVGLAAVGKSRVIAVSDGAVTAKAANEASVMTEDYPLSRRLYLYGSPGLSSLGFELLAFINSDSGQNVVQSTGFIGLKLKSVTHAVNPAAPKEYLEDIVRNAERLGLNVRFQERRGDLDARAQRDMERIIDFMKRPENRDKRLRVAGFADARELPMMSLNLSIERADFVAEYLGRRGVIVERSRGFGNAIPITSTQDDRGRARNRRVEVWIARRETRPSMSVSATASPAP